MTQDLFKKFLELAVKNSFFIFNNKFYQQIEGLGMGIPIAPVFANIFMSHYEKIWLDECPPSIKPFLYRRYVDDTFLLFKNKSQIPKFLQYVNAKHPKIKFTAEYEDQNSLPFLDIKIQRSSNTFHTTVYRKESFSGLNSSYFSHCCKKFKLNSVKTLINRAYNICSSTSSLYNEFEYLKTLFFSNGYPRTLVGKLIRDFLNKKSTCETPPSQPKKSLYFSLPYYGHKSVLLSIEIQKLITSYFTELEPRATLVNNFKISHIFPFKDVLPKELRSSIVYKYSCVHGMCTSAYVGSTVRTLHTRVSEHLGISNRTGHPLTNPPQSSIRNHALQCSTSDITIDHFDVLASANSLTHLRILESLYIYKLKPDLNENFSAFPLKIVNR